MYFKPIHNISDNTVVAVQDILCVGLFAVLTDHRKNRGVIIKTTKLNVMQYYFNR